MTVKELIEKLKELPEHAIVYYEYDGPDASGEITAKDVSYEYNEKVVIR